MTKVLLIDDDRQLAGMMAGLLAKHGYELNWHDSGRHLPGPDVAMSLTAVENLAAACLAALDWPGGAYKIADARPYRRDEVLARVLGVPVRHVPAGLVRGLAAVTPSLTRYAVDQLTDGMVLDIGRALARGYRPERELADYLV